MKKIVFVIAFLIPALASAETPYAGMQFRSIKALSDQQVADLRAGSLPSSTAIRGPRMCWNSRISWD